MHFLILYLVFLFPNAEVGPGTAAALAKEFHIDYPSNPVPEYVQFAKACVEGTGPCYQ